MEELHIKLFEAGNQIKKLKYSELLEGLSFREFTALAITAEQKKNGKAISNVSEMAIAIKCSVQSLSRTIRNLEKRGLVKRVSAPDNRRNTIVMITDQGEEIFEKNHEIMKKFLNNALRKMPEEELIQYISILNHMHEILKDEIERTIKERTGKED